MKNALLPRNLRRAEFARTAYRVTLPVGISLNDALDPSYWVHVHEKLGLYDRLEIIHEDGSFFAEALVTQLPSEKRPLRLAVLSHTVLSLTSSRTHTDTVDKMPVPRRADLPDGYEIKHHPRTGWRVLKDGAELSRHGTRDDAADAVTEHASETEAA